MKRLQKWLLCFLLAWFPMQTVALPAFSTLCVQQGGAPLADETNGDKSHADQGHADPMHAHDHEANAAQPDAGGAGASSGASTSAHDHAHDASSSGAGHAVHSAGAHTCCDHHFTGMLFAAASLPDNVTPAQVPAPSQILLLFVPEQPLHPPSS